MYKHGWITRLKNMFLIPKRTGNEVNFVERLSKSKLDADT